MVVRWFDFVNKNPAYQCTETSIIYLLLWMARMEMDCNLKTLASFFKFLLSILEKLPKADYSLFFPVKSFHIFFPVL